MILNPIQSTLQTLQGMSDKAINNLIDRMAFNSQLYNETVFPDIMCKYLTLDEKESFLNGSLPRHDYVPMHHKQYNDTLDRAFKGELTYAMLVFFRGAAKTAKKRMALTQNVCYGHRLCVPLIGATEGASIKDISAVQRNIQYNKIIQFLFGNLKGTIWNATGAEFFSPDGTQIKYLAYGIFGHLRGILEGDNRPDLVWLDEFETEKLCYNEDQMKKISEIIYHEVYRLGEGNDRTIYMHTNTIPHPLSFTAKAKNNEIFQGPKGVYLEFPVSDSPSIYRDDDGAITIDEEFVIGDLTWERAYNEAYIKQEYKKYSRNNDISGFFQELYNIPKQETESKFKTDLIREMDVRYIANHKLTYIEKMVGENLKRVHTYSFTGHDPASGRKDNVKNDDTAVVTICKVPMNTVNGIEYIYIILDIYFGKIDVEEQRDVVFRHYDTFRPKATMIETIVMQYGIYTLCMNKKEKIKSNINIQRYEDSINKDKKFIDYLKPIVNNGKMYYIKGCPFIDVLKRQLKLRKSNARKDDIVDALWLAFIASEPYDVPIINISQTLMTLARKTNKLFLPNTEPLNYMER